MRRLTMTQKKMIARERSITPSLLQALEKQNDYETLYQDAYRFHGDLQVQRQAQTIYRCMNFNQQKHYNEEKYIKDWR